MNHASNLKGMSICGVLPDENNRLFAALTHETQSMVRCNDCRKLLGLELIPDSTSTQVHVHYEMVTVPEGFWLVALRRWTYDRKPEYYDACNSHPGNVDSIMRENENYEPGYRWEPLFATKET